MSGMGVYDNNQGFTSNNNQNQFDGNFSINASVNVGYTG